LLVVEKLIALGAYVNFQNKNGFTPLNAAYRYSHVKVVEKVIGLNSDVNISNKKGFMSRTQFLYKKTVIKRCFY